MMRIEVYAADAQRWCGLLREHMPGAQVAAADTRPGTATADYLLAWQPPAELLRHNHGAKAIFCLGAGVDALLANPGLDPDVPIIKLRDAGMAPLMVEYVRHAVTHFRLNFDQYLAAEAAGRWLQVERSAPGDWPVGILGLGAIGREVAAALVSDGYPVHGWSRSAKTLDGVVCHHGDQGLMELAVQVNSIVALLPDTPGTAGIVGRQLLAQLPRGVSVINPGRGRLVDTTALLEAIDAGHVRGAILDAFADEPLPAGSALWRHPQVRVTPHVAAPTPRGAAARQIAETIRALERGEAVATVDRGLGY